MKKFLTVLALSALSSSMVHAAVAGGQSDNTTIEVGSSIWIPAGPHKGAMGQPGIGMAGVSLGKWAKVSLKSMKTMITQAEYQSYGATDANGVTAITPPSHGKTAMGNLNFAELPTNSAEVYYGEWSAYNDTTGATRSVYYVGKDRTTNMPTSGTATYAVKGINQYNGSNQLSGTFTADFGSNKLNGSIANNALTVAVNANINTSAASFNGTATAAGQTGSSQGHFFGNNAASLAGFAKFDNRNLDTAFGGVKQ